MEVANAQELMDAIEEDQDAVFEVLAIGIANSIEGVSPENVTVFDVQLVTRRLLDEIEEIVRRLAQGSIKVHYVIHLDNEEAAKAGVNADTVSAQLTTYGAAAIMAAFQDNNQGITFNFTLTVLSVAAEPPSQEVVQQPIVPTVTQTTTQTFSAVSPLDQSKGSASAASAGVVVAAFLMFIFVVVATCAVKFIFARKRKKQELPKFQSVEEGQVADLEPQHIIWHVDELRIASAASEPAASEPAPSIIADFEEELPTPILPDGSQVEYWSRTHSIWLPGVLHVVMVPGTLVSEPKVTYNIEVNTGGNKVQLRANVPIDGFRMPLARGEPVEVHSASAKKWLPAVVDGRQGSPTLQGYRLVLTPGAGDGIAGRVLEKVPAARVRRRFHQGALVSRYVGPVDGFETGFVDETGQAEPLGDNAFGPGLIGPSPSTVSLYSKISNLSMPAAPAGSTLAWDKNMENATGTPDQSNLGEICQWSWIKYSSCEDDSSVVVPSFCLSTLAQE